LISEFAIQIVSGCYLFLKNKFVRNLPCTIYFAVFQLLISRYLQLIAQNPVTKLAYQILRYGNPVFVHTRKI
jgi:hypothetical protein